MLTLWLFKMEPVSRKYIKCTWMRVSPISKEAKPRQVRSIVRQPKQESPRLQSDKDADTSKQKMSLIFKPLLMFFLCNVLGKQHKYKNDHKGASVAPILATNCNWLTSKWPRETLVVQSLFTMGFLMKATKETHQRYQIVGQSSFGHCSDGI